jgi:hypothetical protein
MTYHSTALAESFLSAPNTGDLTGENDDFNLPYETNHWFFLDAIDVLAPADTRVPVGAGSSSVDGSITTPDNNDRFLNWMSTQATYDAHNQINAFILHSGVFDSTADFYTVTADPITKVLLPQYATHSDPNGTPDFLHVGRAGAEAEASTLDISFFAPDQHWSPNKTLSMAK